MQLVKWWFAVKWQFTTTAPAPPRTHPYVKMVSPGGKLTKAKDTEAASGKGNNKKSVAVSKNQETVCSTARQRTVGSPVRQRTIRSPTRQRTIRSPARQRTVRSPMRQKTVGSPTSKYQTRNEQPSTLGGIFDPIVEARGRLVIENDMSDDDDGMTAAKKSPKCNGKKGKDKHVSECVSQNRIQSSDEGNDKSDFSSEKKKSPKSNARNKGKGKSLSDRRKRTQSSEEASDGREKSPKGDVTMEQKKSRTNASHLNETESTSGELWREGHSGNSVVNTRTGEEMSPDSAMRATLSSMRQLLMKHKIHVQSQSKYDETQDEGNQNAGQYEENDNNSTIHEPGHDDGYNGDAENDKDKERRKKVRNVKFWMKVKKMKREMRNIHVKVQMSRSKMVKMKEERRKKRRIGNEKMFIEVKKRRKNMITKKKRKGNGRKKELKIRKT